MSKLNTSSMLSKSTNTQKCKKPCQSSSSSSSCCTVQRINCCTPQYQILSAFRNNTIYNQLGSDWDLEVNKNNGFGSEGDEVIMKNRCGNVIAPPNTAAAISSNNSAGLTGAYVNGCYTSSRADGLNGQPVSFVINSDEDVAGDIYDRSETSADMLVAASAYYFVNEYSYGEYEPGCHSDQVYGWYVNMSTGELQLFTPFEGVPVNATRGCLILQATPSNANLTSTQKKQLKVLNKLYKLSKSAVKEINGIPSQRGDIVEVCDCKGGRWLLYINTASSQNGSPLSTCNYQFAIVATKLC